MYTYEIPAIYREYAQQDDEQAFLNWRCLGWFVNRDMSHIEGCSEKEIRRAIDYYSDVLLQIHNNA